jgi:DNA-binding Lrp family transcriptional regulator
LILLALRAKFRGLESSISDYHRDLKRIFDFDLCYGAVRNRLKKLEARELLKSRLVKGFVSNDLVDSSGVKLSRHTKVFKRIYCPSDCREEVKRFLRSLKAIAKSLGKKPSQVFYNDEVLNVHSCGSVARRDGIRAIVKYR